MNTRTDMAHEALRRCPELAGISLKCCIITYIISISKMSFTITGLN